MTAADGKSSAPGTSQVRPARRLVVDEESVGQRIDRWLAALLPDTSRTEIQRLIRADQIQVNGQTSKASYPLELGDVVTVEAPAEPAPLAESATRAEELPLTILYQDADILVVDKPSGMVVHPAPGHSGGTLVNALLHHVPDMVQIGGERRPGIVHRLDKDTSGLLIIAKHDRALRYLQNQFKARTVRKEYLALVEGVPDPPAQTIDVPLGRHPVDRKRQAALPPHLHAPGIRVRVAETEILRRAIYNVPVKGSTATGNFSLISAYPKTGRTHQIRVHLAWIKHPIVGDPLYGLKPPRLPVPRLFLHAHRIEFLLPATGESVAFESPLPPELAAFIERLAGLSV